MKTDRPCSAKWMMHIICTPDSGGGRSPQGKLYSGGEFLLLCIFPTRRRQGELVL